MRLKLCAARNRRGRFSARRGADGRYVHRYHQASVSPTLQLSFAAELRHCNELPLDSHWLHRKPMKHSAKWNRRPDPGTGRGRHTRRITHRPSEARIRRSCPDRFTGYLFTVWSKHRDVRAQISRRHRKPVQCRAKRGRRLKRCAHIIIPLGLQFQLRACRVVRQALALGGGAGPTRQPRAMTHRDTGIPSIHSRHRPLPSSRHLKDDTVLCQADRRVRHRQHRRVDH